MTEVTEQQEQQQQIQRDELKTAKLLKKEKLAKYAAESLRRIDAAIAYIDKQMASSPSSPTLAKLHTDYLTLHQRADAISKALGKNADTVDHHADADEHHDDGHHEHIDDAHGLRAHETELQHLQGDYLHVLERHDRHNQHIGYGEHAPGYARGLHI